MAARSADTTAVIVSSCLARGASGSAAARGTEGAAVLRQLETITAGNPAARMLVRTTRELLEIQQWETLAVTAGNPAADTLLRITRLPLMKSQHSIASSDCCSFHKLTPAAGTLVCCATNGCTCYFFKHNSK
jgi:hypothetical protein